MIWCLRLAQCYLKIILSNRQCLPLLHAWWIYIKHAKHAEHAEHAEHTEHAEYAEHAETGNLQRKKKSNNQRPRKLKIKRGDYSNTEFTIIFGVIFPIIVCKFDFEASKSGKVYPAIHRSGCRVLMKAMQ